MKTFSWHYDRAQEGPPDWGRGGSLAHALEERFEVLGLLGTGGMGTVYRARERQTGRLLAVKLLHSVTAKAKQRMLSREGALTAQLQHPGIIAVHSGGELGDGAYLAYELVEGCRPLKADAGEEGRRVFLERLHTAAQAVGHAHGQGIVHRDLKPDNLLVDAEGRVRVADFGLAWARDVERLTESHTMLGTPLYMPLEAFRGGQPEPTVDVWALGVVLYEGLTGEPPITGSSLLELMARLSKGSFDSARRVDPTISPALSAVCDRALAKNPVDRYPDALAFADALRQALAASHGRRRPAVARAAMAGALALVFLAIAGTLATSGPAPEPEPSVPTAEPPEDKARAEAREPSGTGKPAFLFEVRHPTGSKRIPGDPVPFWLRDGFVSVNVMGDHGLCRFDGRGTFLGGQETPESHSLVLPRHGWLVAQRVGEALLLDTDLQRTGPWEVYPFPPGERAVRVACRLPSGTLLVGLDSGEFFELDLSARTWTRRFGLPGRPLGVSLTPDGRSVFAAAWGGGFGISRMMLVDRQTWEERSQRHFRSASHFDFDFLGDATLVVTGRYDVSLVPFVGFAFGEPSYFGAGVEAVGAEDELQGGFGNPPPVAHAYKVRSVSCWKGRVYTTSDAPGGGGTLRVWDGASRALLWEVDLPGKPRAASVDERGLLLGFDGPVIRCYSVE